MIPESFVQDLLARIDVADVVGRYVQLRKGGANLLGLCPFHNEKSPSFTVSPVKQFYHCFGCGAHGTAITFLMEHTGASFPEAVRTLAASAGLTVPEAQRSPAQREAARRHKEETSRHQQILDTAQAHYQRSLKSSPAAIQYLKQRGLTGETAARFGLGWSGTDRRGLAAVFANYEEAALIEAGLVIESEDGRRYDRFRERVMFPIRNTRGQVVGFGGRLIVKGEPKYLNSPETPLFSKGSELYGLWEARAAIRSEGCVVVVEGYMDVVALAQQGVHHAVATLGTATTPQHIQKLLRASDRIVFSFDGDTAGRKAAWRALQVCLPLLRDDVALRFLFLPPEHDPDSYVAAYGAQAFRAAVAEAPSLSRFLLDELAARHDLNEAEGRAACVHEAAPLLTQMPDGALRIQIERELAAVVRLTAEELRRMLSQRDAVRPPAAPQAPREAAPPPAPHSDGFPDYMPDDVPSYEPDIPWAAPPEAAPRRGRQQRSHAVRPLARRMLRLLLAHPELVERTGYQQLEIIASSPQLILVNELIGLVRSSGATHAGALQQAAEPESELAAVLPGLTSELLEQDDLPDPAAEWNDALRQAELVVIKAEQDALVQGGLKDDASRERYRKLMRRLALLSGVSPPQVG